MIISEHIIISNVGNRSTTNKVLMAKCDHCQYNFVINRCIKEKMSKDFHFCSFQCSRKSMKKDGILYKKSQNTSMIKYGTKHHMKNDKQKEKVKNTNLLKYGCEFPLQTKDLQEKTKKTNIEKYGFSNPMKNEKVKSKQLKLCHDKTDLEKKLIKEKRKQTSIREYGTEYPQQSEIIKNKISYSSIGKKMSKEAREKMSIFRKTISGEKHPLYGKARDDIRGSKNPNWNGGVTSLYKKIRLLSSYKEWRRYCFTRDKWKCTMCNKAKCELHVDHIKPFALIVNENNISNTIDAVNVKELWNVGNGRTLCIKCHQKTNTYGYKTRKILRKINGYI